MLIDRLLLSSPVLCLGCLEFVHRLTSDQIFFFLLRGWHRGHLLWIHFFAWCLMYSWLLHYRSIIVIVFRWLLLFRCQITLFWRVWRHSCHLAPCCILWPLDCHLALLIVDIIHLFVVATNVVVVTLVHSTSVRSSLFAAVNDSCLFMIMTRRIMLLLLLVLRHPSLLLHCLLTGRWRLLGWRSTIVVVVFLLWLGLIHIRLTAWVLIYQLLC